MMSGIFISYRREDSIAQAGRLYDRLHAHFGSEKVFMDIDTIEPGEDFVEVIEQTLASCNVVLVIIGRQWLAPADTSGRRRLENSKDFLRLEITGALNRNIPIIPVLVSGAEMPNEYDLPDDLRPLARRQALKVPDVGFHSAVDRLILAIEKNMKAAPQVTIRPPNQRQSAVHNVEPDAAGEKVTGQVTWAPRLSSSNPSSNPVEAPQASERFQIAKPEGRRNDLHYLSWVVGSPRWRYLAGGLVLVLITVGLMIPLLSRSVRDSPPSAVANVSKPNVPSSVDPSPPKVKPPAQTDQSSNSAKNVESSADEIARLSKMIGLDKNPRDPDLHWKLAEMLSGDAAIAEYRKATQLPPKDIGSAFLYRDLAEALERKGDLDEALAAAQQSVRRWPKKNNLFCNGSEERMLIRLLEKKGMIDQAIEFYRPLVERNSDFKECRDAYNGLLAAKKAHGL